jgi:hypothetical protein
MEVHQARALQLYPPPPPASLLRERASAGLDVVGNIVTPRR